jgi:hypothetical protein
MNDKKIIILGFLIIILFSCVENNLNNKPKSKTKPVQLILSENKGFLSLDSNKMYTLTKKSTRELGLYDYSLNTEDDKISFQGGQIDTFFILNKKNENINLIVIKTAEGVNNFFNIFTFPIKNKKIYNNKNNPQFFEDISGDYNISLINKTFFIKGKRHQINDAPCCPSEIFNCKMKISNTDIFNPKWVKY